ncbi:MAG: Gfo/Idh/MocA family oxidoreductase [Anaerolineae bacterium]|jgi:predicted dehydrogenase|nr:Gfo/Idh/MocA family oxidoreductase [Anaerolineae bacterium]
MTQPTRVAVIGVGQIGQVHLQTYLNMPDVEVIAIVGRDPQRTTAVAERYHIKHWTIDYHSLLESMEIDAVSVCLHNNYHKPVAVAALQAGKHVYCEKPIAGTYRDGLTMVQAAEKSRKLLSIQLASLFSPQTKAAQHAIQQGWLGKPYHAHSAGFRRRGRPYVDGYGSPAFVQKSQAAGGVLLDMGVYFLGSLLYLLGNPAPLCICGQTYQETPIDPHRLEQSEYDVEEMGLGFIRLAGGITLTLAQAWAMHLDSLGGSYLVGSEGGIRLEPFALFRSLGDLDLDATADMDHFMFRLHNIREQGPAWESPQHHFIAAVRGQVEPLPTAEITLNTLLISEGIYLSSALGREVGVDEVMTQSKTTAVDV